MRVNSAKLSLTELKTDADILSFAPAQHGNVKPKKTRRRKVKSVIRMSDQEYKSRKTSRSGIRPAQPTRVEIRTGDEKLSDARREVAVGSGKGSLDLRQAKLAEQHRL